MNIINSIKCSDLTFEQKALTRQADHNWSNFQKMILGPYINYTYPYKNHEGFVLDHLIVGANPVLNYFLLKKLFIYLKDNMNTINKPIKIGLLIPDTSDYWGYQFMKHPDFWLRLNKAFYNSSNPSIFTLTSESINDFNNFFNDSKVAELYLIDNQFFEPSFVFNNHFSSEYVIQLIDKKPVDDYHWFHQEKLGVLLKQQKKISDNIYKNFIDKFEKFSPVLNSLKYLQYSEQKHFSTKEHNAIPLHFLLTNHIWSTSFPYNWFNLEKHETIEPKFDSLFSNNEFSYTKLTHKFSHMAFGSSYHSCNQFLGLEEQAIYDIIAILKCNIQEKILLDNKLKYESI